MARNTYSAGKRQRERDKLQKKKEKEQRRQQNRDRGVVDIPIATVEELQGGAMISAEQAAAQGAGLHIESEEGESTQRATSGVPVRLFVGGLNWSATDASLREIFEKLGPVKDAAIVTDRDTGDSRGFGFVTMADRRDASRAVKELSGKEIDGRTIVVKPATERRR